MEIVKIFLLVVGILALAVFGLALQIIFKKQHRFPEIHIGKNPEMRKRGIACATSFDKAERAKEHKHIKYESIRISENKK